MFGWYVFKSAITFLPVDDIREAQFCEKIAPVRILLVKLQKIYMSACTQIYLKISISLWVKTYNPTAVWLPALPLRPAPMRAPAPQLGPGSTRSSVLPLGPIGGARKAVINSSDSSGQKVYLNITIGLRYLVRCYAIPNNFSDNMWLVFFLLS